MAALIEEYRGEAVRDPIPFPPPHFNGFSILQGRIIEGDVETVREVFSSESGAFYERGNVYLHSVPESITGYVLESISPGQFRRTGQLVTIRIANRSQHEAPGGVFTAFMNNIACLQYIRDTATPANPTPPNRYPNICYLYEACMNADFFLMVVEYATMDLFATIEENDKETARSLFRGILEGWSVLYGFGISNRDISCENLMISNTGQAMIMDFGVALRSSFQPSGEHCYFPPLGPHGILRYTAPEVFQNVNPFKGCHADLWALGVVLFMMLFRHPPFERPTDRDHCFASIGSGRLRDMVASWGHDFSPESMDLLTRLLKVEPTERIQHGELMVHPWFAAPVP